MVLSGHCRFLWVIQYFVGAGFYVMPAYQPADNSVDNTVVSVSGIFSRNWANVWAAITDLPTYNSTLKVCTLLTVFFNVLDPSAPDIVSSPRA